MSCEQQERIAIYRLLARLIIVPADKPIINGLTSFIDEEESQSGGLVSAFRRLSKTSARADLILLNEEFDRLFTGLGSSELSPYYSYYETGFLMEKPLARLRTDLKRLGFKRQAGNNEPEDHISAISEVMALLIEEGHSEQCDFFQHHVSPWFGRFFADLESGTAEPFYRAVAELGSAFMQAENLFYSRSNPTRY